MPYNGFTLFDGGMGTMLQKAGMPAGMRPEQYNLTDPALIRSIQAQYVAAGADVITANTFGATEHKLGAQAAEAAAAGVRIAREAGARRVALDLGPTGAMLAPLGAMPFDEAYEQFAAQVRAGAPGADLVLIETMSDLLEAKAALLAAKENCALPVFVTMSFAADGRSFLGCDPKTAAVTLASLGADAVGINCSLGPRELLPLVREMAGCVRVPLLVQPNAGLPRIVEGRTVFDVGPEEFAGLVGALLDAGVTMAGGCCGTTPEHIRALRREMERRTARQPAYRPCTRITSGQRTVELDGTNTVVIGERINPTGRKKLRRLFAEADWTAIAGEAIEQEEAGADLLDVNAGLPDLDEAEVLPRLIGELQAVTPLPLQIDSSDPAAIEAAVRVYCGKPLINSVNGKRESMDAILPIVKQYGAAVVALTLDENGIPPTAEERLAIARRIVERAEAMGIPREDVLVDCLVLTASTNQAMVLQTLRAVSLVRRELGCRTVLGVSNVSFGLPARETLNATFLGAAFGAGLDMPILNPLSKKYMEVVSAFRVLSNQDAGAAAFIAAHAVSAETPAAPQPAGDEAPDVRTLILSGRRDRIEEAVRRELQDKEPMEIINGQIIPALDTVGARFERGEVFLPQLMASAETAKQGFALLRAASPADRVQTRGRVLLATVHGDIHDIGKNIVRMLLENYGFSVLDLGRDVPAETVVQAVLREKIRLVGLSALMTTTVRSMAETIAALRAAGADCRIMVGGAVLTQEYAEMVGADFYARDAAESARIAAQVFGG
ncbi:MAG: homocysteine S-methyltransferase family protein [Clostridiales bacterium]|nr:homocysteine S-methyltransferase family protein [Clostridiales bacterium]